MGNTIKEHLPEVHSLAATKTRCSHVAAKRAKGVGREGEEKRELSWYPRLVRAAAG